MVFVDLAFNLPSEHGLAFRFWSAPFPAYLRTMNELTASSLEQVLETAMFLFVLRFFAHTSSNVLLLILLVQELKCRGFVRPPRLIYHEHTLFLDKMYRRAEDILSMDQGFIPGTSY